MTIQTSSGSSSNPRYLQVTCYNGERSRSRQPSTTVSSCTSVHIIIWSEVRFSTYATLASAALAATADLAFLCWLHMPCRRLLLGKCNSKNEHCSVSLTSRRTMPIQPLTSHSPTQQSTIPSTQTRGLLHVLRWLQNTPWIPWGQASLSCPLASSLLGKPGDEDSTTTRHSTAGGGSSSKQ